MNNNDNCDITNIIEECSKIIEDKGRGKALDYLFDKVDDQILLGNFEQVEEILKTTDIQTTHEDLLLGLLTITGHFSCGHTFKNRDEFKDNVYAMFKERYGEEEAKQIMQGL
jgi:hypothetical protein